MRRLLTLAGSIALIWPGSCYADAVDVDVYATKLLERNRMMIEATTSQHEKDRLDAAGETVKVLQSRYDHRVILADDLYPLLKDFDGKTAGGTLSDQDYTAFLQEAQPTLDVICNTC